MLTAIDSNWLLAGLVVAFVWLLAIVFVVALCKASAQREAAVRSAFERSHPQWLRDPWRPAPPVFIDADEPTVQ